jgi:hypothetical protein
VIGTRLTDFRRRLLQVKFYVNHVFIIFKYKILVMVEIIQMVSKISKAYKSNDNYSGHLQETDKPSFALVNTPALKIFNIKNNIYHTNIETDFILDIDIQTLIQFEISKLEITANDLYELYLAAKENENQTIRKHPDIEKIWSLLHINKAIHKRPFEILEDTLKEVLKKFPNVQGN